MRHSRIRTQRTDGSASSNLVHRRYNRFLSPSIFHAFFVSVIIMSLPSQSATSRTRMQLSAFLHAARNARAFAALSGLWSRYRASSCWICTSALHAGPNSDEFGRQVMPAHMQCCGPWPPLAELERSHSRSLRRRLAALCGGKLDEQGVPGAAGATLALSRHGPRTPRLRSKCKHRSDN